MRGDAVEEVSGCGVSDWKREWVLVAYYHSAFDGRVDREGARVFLRAGALACGSTSCV